MASITCGKCKGKHGSAAEVRACYRPVTPKTTPLWAKANMTRVTKTDAPIANVLTRRQSDYIYGLMNEVAKLADLPQLEVDEAGFYNSMSRVTKSAASKMIDQLKDKAFELSGQKDRKAERAVEVPNGRYAIEREGTLKFYKINTPTDGKWAGRTFVDAQASDELHPIRNTSARREILATIATDPQAAMLRYGQELGHCGHCGRTLTNEVSRERGIGPVCAEKMGW
jgi:hypothetical protein